MRRCLTLKYAIHLLRSARRRRERAWADVKLAEQLVERLYPGALSGARPPTSAFASVPLLIGNP